MSLVPKNMCGLVHSEEQFESVMIDLANHSHVVSRGGELIMASGEARRG